MTTRRPQRLTRLARLLAFTALLSLLPACNDNPPAPSPTPAVVDRPVVEIDDGLRLEPEDSEWDGYGQAVDVRGDLMIVGASDWNTDGAGSAYVYRFSDAEQTWQEEARLLPSGEDGRRMRHLFGAAVAIGDEAIAVGAPGADDPVYGANTGAVYIFEYLDGRWTETAKLRSNRPDGNGGQEPLGWLRRGRLRPRAFGAVVALQGDTLAVGGESSTGTVYVYRRDEQGWQEQARITTPTLPETDLYMTSLALADDTLALSALHMAPDQSEVAPFIRGRVAVYLFRRADDDSWPEQFRYSPQPEGTELLFARQVHLGASVALSNAPDGQALLAVGLPGFPDVSDFRDQTGQYPGVVFPDSARQTGSVILFERQCNGLQTLSGNCRDWQEHTTLRLPGSNSPPGPGPMFSNDSASALFQAGAVGQPSRDSETQGNAEPETTPSPYVFPGHFYSENPDVSFFGATVDLDEQDLVVTSGYTNITYVFEQQDGDWGARFKIKPRAPENGLWEDFAQVAALSGDTVLLGAPGEFGDAAYVFELPD